MLENLAVDKAMRAKIALLLSASLLGSAIAAQPVPCASVAAEVRDRVREAGACRDADDAALKAAAALSGTVTMKLSDGTVVTIPREISSSINGRKRAVTNEPAPPKSVSRAGKFAQSGPGASGNPPPALRTVQVPDVIGRSAADAGSALAQFNVERVQTASAAPAGEVLAQEPGAASLVPPGSTVTLQVSDGSLAAASGAGIPAVTEVPMPAPAAAATPAPAPVAELAPPTTRTSETATRGFQNVFSANSALILGAGVSLGLILGALLMRQWLRRRDSMADEIAAAPALYLNQSVDTGSVASAPEVVAEVRFAARRDPSETTIEFVALADDEALAIEQSSEQHG